ncbi:oligosaccharide flippase family protein [Niallia alba]|uniref:oligosaccharide flippase family protein n=1 Tax=Niallia alba TaxID=2729105 RepID=UPI002E1C03FB|nr:oligosaccharide flippase family protein [Niallia alba]
MKKKPLILNVYYNLVAVFIQNLVSLLGLSIISRKFGPEIFGEINAFISFVAIFIPLIIHGASNYYSREYSRNENETATLSRFFRYTFISSLILVIILGCFLGGTKLYSVQFTTIVVYLIFMLIGNSLDIQWLFRMKEDTKLVAKTSIVSSIIFIGLIVLFLTKMTIEVYLIIYSFNRLFNNIIYLYYIKDKKAIFRKTRKMDKEYFEDFKPVIVLSLSGLLNLIYVRSDIVMLSYFGFKVETGYYSSAYVIINILFVLRGTLISLVVPILLKSFNKSIDYFKSKLSAFLKLGMFLGLLLVGVTFICEKPIIMLLFGKEFINSLPAFNILLGMTLVVYINFGISATLIVTNNDKYFTIATLLAAIINILGNFLFIPHYGMVAAATTTLLAEAVILIYSLFKLRKSSLALTKLLVKSNLKIFISGIILIIISYLIKETLQVNSILIGILYIVIFLLVSYYFKFFSKNEIDHITKVTK